MVPARNPRGKNFSKASITSLQLLELQELREFRPREHGFDTSTYNCLVRSR